MDLLLCYDIDSNWVKVKQELKDIGFMDRFTFDGQTRFLPDTTLWKKDDSDCNKAIDDLWIIALSLGVKVERAIAIPWGYDKWTAITGYPHKP